MSATQTKLYCYVDETGQDPRSGVFIVVVVAVGEERDALRQVLKEVEFTSRKASKKWAKATTIQQAAYCAAISQVTTLQHKVFFARHTKPANYLEATVQTIRKALHEAANLQPVQAVVLIDGLHKNMRHKVKAMVRDHLITVDKLRGVRDESDEFIRLADAAAGLIRAHIEAESFATPLYQTMTKRGILTEVK